MKNPQQTFKNKSNLEKNIAFIIDGKDKTQVVNNLLKLFQEELEILEKQKEPNIQILNHDRRTQKNI